MHLHNREEKPAVYRQSQSPPRELVLVRGMTETTIEVDYPLTLS